MFDGFTLDRIDVGDVVLRVRQGGTGPPVVLLHGHPRTHTTWHRVAPLLATHFSVVCPDLRGYGESSKPPDRTDHGQASKRAMADDIIRLMQRLGYERFAVVGHDRGAYVAFRAALDHPDSITHLVILDAVPIGDALARTDATFATTWWHWFFFGQPDRPERAILGDPDAWYRADESALGPENYADFRAAIHDPATVHAMIGDYRAGLGVDRATDDADRAAGRRVQCPTLVMWARADDLPALYGDRVAIWRSWASNVRGQPVDGGHQMAEENPVELASKIAQFLRLSPADLRAANASSAVPLAARVPRTGELRATVERMEAKLHARSDVASAGLAETYERVARRFDHDLADPRDVLLSRGAALMLIQELVRDPTDTTKA